MATAAQAPATPTATDPVEAWLQRRAATNRANSLHSTGPRTEPGKRHGLTVHIQQFLDEYAPAAQTETQLVHEIPLLEAELLSQNPNPQTLIPMLATLGLHGSRLSRQFKKPSINSAPSRKNVSAWSAASSLKPPKSSYAISAKEFPGRPPAFS